MANPKGPSDIDARMSLTGRICVHWAYLELLLSATIWGQIKVDEPTGKIITGGLDIIPRARMALRLAKHQRAPAKLRAALSKALEDIEDISGERNLAVHGVYGYDEETGNVTAEVHRGKYQGTEQEMSIPRLYDVAARISDAIERLEPVLEAHGFIDLEPPTRPPSGGKSRKRSRRGNPNQSRT